MTGNTAAALAVIVRCYVRRPTVVGLATTQAFWLRRAARAIREKFCPRTGRTPPGRRCCRDRTADGSQSGGPRGQGLTEHREGALAPLVDAAALTGVDLRADAGPDAVADRDGDNPGAQFRVPGGSAAPRPPGRAGGEQGL